MAEKKYVLTGEIADKKLRRMALQVAEQNCDAAQLILIGIKDNGLIIAQKIQSYLQGVFSGDVFVVELTLNKKKPMLVSLDPAMDFNGKSVLLIDDVANSGKTMLYALKPLLETYPNKIQTLVLVERTHKSFPIAVDYLGISISTALDEHITVEVNNGEVRGAWVEEIPAI